ncbi:unnamed protein product [Schistocephalus solidus]|uniref:Peptidase A1 domain-containing protein n=1 Tax=Schistocephalus solidus TaxID=70667 RepID=A0A183T9D9_SCHSO|nr:unnamed protein product [Schistocephalus solidus]
MQIHKTYLNCVRARKNANVGVFIDGGTSATVKIPANQSNNQTVNIDSHWNTLYPSEAQLSWGVFLGSEQAVTNPPPAPVMSHRSDDLAMGAGSHSQSLNVRSA